MIFLTPTGNRIILNKLLSKSRNQYHLKCDLHMPGILFFNPRAVQYKEMSTEDHGSWINCAVERNTHRSNESWINCANRLISEMESQICINEDLV